MTASPLEQVWTAIAVAGFVFSAWLAADGWIDLSAVRAGVRARPPRARIWGPRWWIALSSIVANGLLCLVWLGFGLIGVVAMGYPPPTPSPDQHVSNMWVGWVLIGMEALLALVQGWHLFVRGRVSNATKEAARDAP
jgi:Na+/proline symporter